MGQPHQADGQQASAATNRLPGASATPSRQPDRHQPRQADSQAGVNRPNRQPSGHQPQQADSQTGASRAEPAAGWASRRVDGSGPRPARTARGAQSTTIPHERRSGSRAASGAGSAMTPLASPQLRATRPTKTNQDARQTRTPGRPDVGRPCGRWDRLAGRTMARPPRQLGHHAPAPRPRPAHSAHVRLGQHSATR